ncbi:hypothetical protein [Alkaliphilus serpentinus]|uniref:Uncharacterized protein n=1 Tax=Alkaliphilus serpentinus TaxID=1482731 RepID=A0A833M8U6_9FIRM|nr:hypothetical protein [Alkaliphilus serpentinus]KAB3525676.1 hypothetical protein F8153_14795 [Alkaliphilus serpentinus]
MQNDENIEVLNDFQKLYKVGFRCVYYEIDEDIDSFTAYLKNFETEKIEILQCSTEEGNYLMKYINKLN